MPQGLHEFQLHPLRQAADVVVRLDDGAGAAEGGTGFDDVGIEGPLGEKIRPFDLFRLAVEDLDKGPPDDLALLFRRLHPLEAVEEDPPRPDKTEVHMEMIAEQLPDLLRLPVAQNAVVHEDAGQPGADGAVEEDGGHGGIHAAAQAEDDPAVAHLLPDLRDGVPGEGFHRPVLFAATDDKEEVAEDLPPLRGVDHLRVELEAVETPPRVLGGGDGGVGRGGGGAETGGEPADGVAVAHPAPGGLFHPGQDVAGVQDIEFGEAVFPLGGGDDLAPQGVDHELEAVADPEDGDAQGEDAGVHPGAVLLVDARRPPGEDDPLGMHIPDDGQGDVRRFDLAIDVVFPDPPGDELVVLGTEVDDEDQAGTPLVLYENVHK